MVVSLRALISLQECLIDMIPQLINRLLYAICVLPLYLDVILFLQGASTSW